MTRTRFAPSPTGYMHIGNLRTALYAYLFAKATDGAFVLRIEDTDRERYVDDAVDFIYRTLKGAGISHSEGPDVGGAYGPYVQSEREKLGIYKEQAESLVRLGHAYYCFCDKRDQAIKDTEDDARAGYNRKCRELSSDEIAQKLAACTPYAIRQKIPLTGTTSYDDLVYGHIEVDNASLDDQILLKSDGMPTYNFANVVDDHLMEITHIIRGADFLSSTPKYQLLYKSFGWTPPLYAHLPLIMGQNEDGSTSKLSKRHGATSFEQLTESGYLPEAVTNYVALLGWSPKDEKEIMSVADMANEFSLSSVNKSSAIFDFRKLQWMNGVYIRNMSAADFANTARRFVTLNDRLLESWHKIAALMKDRVEVFTEIQEKIAFLSELPGYCADLYTNKKNKLDLNGSFDVLKRFETELSSVGDFSVENLNAIITAYAEEIGKKIGYVMWPLRIAVSGLAVTPGGATEIMEILGKDEAMRRITRAIEILKWAAPTTHLKPLASEFVLH